jgi:hypothetical protein
MGAFWIPDGHPWTRRTPPSPAARRRFLAQLVNLLVPKRFARTVWWVAPDRPERTEP